MPDIFKASNKENLPDLTKLPKNELDREKYPQHSHNPLAAYSVYPDPDKLRFESKDDEEEIILFLRKHPIINLPWILISILMILAPLILIIVPIFSFLPSTFLIVGVLVWYLVTIAY